MLMHQPCCVVRTSFQHNHFISHAHCAGLSDQTVFYLLEEAQNNTISYSETDDIIIVSDVVRKICYATFKV